ncbi:MAG: hypothetical protein ACETV0_06495 [Nitrososphaeria archaeon]
MSVGIGVSEMESSHWEELIRYTRSRDVEAKQRKRDLNPPVPRR